SDGGPARYSGPRSEVSVLAELGRRVLGDSGPVNWSGLGSHPRGPPLIGELIPGFEPLARIDRTRRAFHISGRQHDRAQVPTVSGKARFQAIALPSLPEANGHALRLMTVRSEGQFNTVVYEEEDIYRAQERRDVVLISGEDLARLRLKTDQRVTVRSAVGEL